MKRRSTRKRISTIRRVRSESDLYNTMMESSRNPTTSAVAAAAELEGEKSTIAKRSASSLSTRRKSSIVKLKSRASLERPLRKLSFQIRSNIDRFSSPLKDLITRSESSDTEPQSPTELPKKPHGFMNAFQLQAKSAQSQKRVILNVGGVKHEGNFNFNRTI